MSHNKIKIGTAEPNASGVISPSITDCSDVSGTPSDGQILQYSSGSWTPQTISSASAVSYIFWGHGESENYDESPATSIGAGDVIYIYDSNGINTISGASISSTTSTGTGGGEWLDSVTLPAGTYRISLTCLPTFSASGYLAFAMYESTTARTSIGTVGALVTSYSNGGAVATSSYTFTSSTTLSPKVTAASNVDSVANLLTSISESTTLFIEKLA